MNLANVYNNISEAYSLSTDPKVLTHLQEALTEISNHMDKEKERVKKYRSKDYVKPDPHTCATDSKGRCKTCGTPLAKAVVIPSPKPVIMDTLTKVAEDIKSKTSHPASPPKDPMDEALALLDSPLPAIHHDGVMDDLEDETVATPDNLEGVLDDLELILSL